MKLVPRKDIRPEEGCFICHDNDGKILGYVQTFKDGSAGYWRTPGEQAKPAATPELACQVLRRLWAAVLE